MVVRLQALSARKLIALDGVRGLAILAVMIHHSSWRVSAGGAPQRLAGWFLFQGWAGVDLFFVLSGFLITGILLDSRKASNYFESFYARRALRIFPLYFAFLGAAFLLFPFLVEADWMPASNDRWLYFTYLTNWLALWHGAWRHSVMAHLWSLAVEEQFYFCWPLLVWLLRPAKLLPSLIVGEIALVTGRWWWAVNHGPSQAIVIATVTRMDGLLLGAICAILIREYRLPDRLVQRLPKLAFTGLVIYSISAMVSANSDRYIQTVGIPLMALISAMIVLFSVATEGADGRIQTLLRGRGLTEVGKHAYGLYVYHVPVFYFGDRLIAAYAPAALQSSFWFGCLASLAMIAASYQIAKVSYHYFEKYFLNWKDRFEPQYAR